jgi:DNA-binding CsgD family transcriptional regulator|tara:strand:- start:62 stop:190 length:129 start_codon:yes stop_codon:yes gene_type:complete
MEQDYNAGKIPYERATEYFLTIETIKNDLNKINIKKNDKQKD